MNEIDVLICGGGIAGAAAAFWLGRAGQRVIVVERAPQPRKGGQAVDVRGAGRTVVERMGLLDQARTIATDQRGLAVVDANGRNLLRMPVDAFDGEGIVSEIEILRGDLAELLYRATLPDTDYIFDDTITAIDVDDHGVTVTLENSEPIRCRLVIGADGSHSVVRGLAFDDRTAVRPLGCYTSWFTVGAEFDLDGWVQMYNAPGGLTAMVRPGHGPDEIKAALSFRSGPLTYDRRDIAAQQDHLRQRFRDAGWRIPRLLDGMSTADDFGFDSMDQIHLPHWHRDRVVLLGDAGYCASPLTGLGTSLALVGAYVLAGELATNPGDHRRALISYEQLMRPYVKQAQQLPPGGIGGYAPDSRLALWLRTASMRASMHWPMRQLMVRQFARADAIDLPGYPLGATVPIC
ncbi:FAD-dependent oxidoreductase [Microlunatus elymi]|uniref:FAD-dependent oxidoreductase n=2 Tax=Microlunatus elymi TaxID=2596828 RepID=A0A516Q520_9ACTN|nr:FAD-dependent oxidoreductase [Microlunatus elymi]